VVEEKIKEILKRAFPQEFNKERSEAYDKLGIQKLNPVKLFEEQKKLNRALLDASVKGDFKKVQELINKGANPNAKDYAKRTPLHHASGGGHDKTVKTLLQNKANIHAKDDAGMTPLHHASNMGRDKTVKTLLQNKANIHAKDDGGWTPLHHASLNGRDKTVRLLLEHAEKHGGIEKLLNATNKKGKRAVDIAKDNVRGVLIEEMRKHGLKI